VHFKLLACCQGDKGHLSAAEEEEEEREKSRELDLQIMSVLMPA
jgi:hypothetical protein